MVTGFQSPAQGYEDRPLDLNQILVRHPNANYFMRIDTDKYKNMAIFKDDILIVDRSKLVHPSSLVVYAKDGGFCLGRVCNIMGEASVEGCVVHVIHTVKE